MQLPQGDRSRWRRIVAKKKQKICQEPGCGKEFYGRPIAKYCPFHQVPSRRQRVKKVLPCYDGSQILPANLHARQSSESLVLRCQLPGCGKEFGIIHIANQGIYPKYCEDHRSEYRREFFLRMQQRGMQEVCELERSRER
jgi:hypothetical protein